MDAELNSKGSSVEKILDKGNETSGDMPNGELTPIRSVLSEAKIIMEDEGAFPAGEKYSPFAGFTLTAGVNRFNAKPFFMVPGNSERTSNFVYGNKVMLSEGCFEENVNMEPVLGNNRDRCSQSGIYVFTAHGADGAYDAQGAGDDHGNVRGRPVMNLRPKQDNNHNSMEHIAKAVSLYRRGRGDCCIGSKSRARERLANALEQQSTRRQRSFDASRSLDLNDNFE